MVATSRSSLRRRVDRFLRSRTTSDSNNGPNIAGSPSNRFGRSTQHGRSERWIDEVAHGRPPQGGPRPEAYRPGWLILHHEYAFESIQVGVDGGTAEHLPSTHVQNQSRGLCFRSYVARHVEELEGFPFLRRDPAGLSGAGRGVVSHRGGRAPRSGGNAARPASQLPWPLPIPSTADQAAGPRRVGHRSPPRVA